MLSAIISRLRSAGRAIPLVASYDVQEKIWTRRCTVSTRERKRAPGSHPTAIRRLLIHALPATGLTDAVMNPSAAHPHDFRRIIVTDAIMNGLPPLPDQLGIGRADVCVKMDALTTGRVNPIIVAGAALLRIRWFVRTPIWMFRARLGFVFGSRLLMLEHVGRVSGRRRYVVLEVVDHPAADRYVVVSGFGERAQWFRNVAANPRVRIFLASHLPALAIASRLDADPAAAALSRYAAAHPQSWAKLRPVLEQTLGARINEHDTELPVIVIELVDPAITLPALGR